MRIKLSHALLTAGISAGMVAPAYAQSSVTLYGLIDAGILYNSNAKGGHQFAMNNSTLQGNRWGLRGSEDLGNGLAAIFVLENGFNLSNGAFAQGGAEFGRQAYVGLSSPYGSITLGRQYDALLDAVSGFTFGNSTHNASTGQLGGVPGMHVGDIDNLSNTTRINNSIKYSSPLYRGLRIVGEYSAGGVAGNFSRNQIWSAGATYSTGPFSIGAGFEKINDPNFSFYGNNPSASATANNVASPVYSGYASAKTQQIATAGTTYTIGNATIGAVYSNIRFTDLGADGAALNPDNLSGNATFNIGEINFAYGLTQAWTLGAAYTYTKGSSINSLSAAKYQQFEIATDYSVSKRTDLYALVIYQRASGYDSTLKPAVATINSLTPSSSNAQTAAIVGIRTKF